VALTRQPRGADEKWMDARGLAAPFGLRWLRAPG